MVKEKKEKEVIDMKNDMEKIGSNLKEFEGWRLLRQRTKKRNGFTHFYEQWIHEESKSGIVFYSEISGKSQPNFYNYTHKKGSVYYVVEGYGIGTINPKTFKEIIDGTLIQHYEYDDVKQGIKGLQELITEKNKHIQ